MKLISTLLLMLSFQFVSSQIVNNTVGFEEEKKVYKKRSEKFTALKRTFRDTVSEESLFYKKNKGYEFSLNPAFDLQYGTQNNNGKDVFKTGIGADIRLKKSRWNIGAAYMHQYGRYMDYQSNFIEQNKVVPSMNVKRGRGEFHSDFISAFLNYRTKSIFDFEIGYGRNFIGDGYRSLLISDYAKSSPYFRATAQFWRIKYTSLMSVHQDIFQVEGQSGLHRRKYTSTHYLDWKINDWFSLGLFESIVWQHQEDNFERGFDANYLNPVIFFRPVEFSVGSSDNAFVGTNMKFTVHQDHHFYFQLVFDEFLLDELKADVQQWLNPDDDIQSGWWANKYGIQVGWKAFDLFGVQGLRGQVEYNSVRPFTYTHRTSTQSYSNFNLPLAHPLGANFREIVSKVDYFKKRAGFHLQWNYARKGFSPLGTNFGENLQIPNESRTNEYENEIGQGNLREVSYVEFIASYMLKKEWNMLFNVGFIYRGEKREDVGQFNNQMISISIRTNLYNQYFDL